MRYDVIIIGGDVRDAEFGLQYLKSGKTVCLIAEGGIIGSPQARAAYAKAGGIILMSDKVEKVDVNPDGTVDSLRTANLGATPLKADLYILASGRFVAGGLKSDMTHVWEPIFGADVQFAEDPESWCKEDFFAPQPFESFGVKTDNDGHVLKDGKPIANLIAMGSIIAKQ